MGCSWCTAASASNLRLVFVSALAVQRIEVPSLPGLPGVRGCDVHPHPRFARHSLPARAQGEGILIDVGANVGLVTLLLADKVQHALLFEPNPIAAQRARENPALNRLNFEVHDLALSDKTGTVGFEDEGGVSTCNRTVSGFSSSVPTPRSPMHSTRRLSGGACFAISQSARSRSMLKGTKIRCWREWRGACAMPGLVW